jgi:hypothetical protein
VAALAMTIAFLAASTAAGTATAHAEGGQARVTFTKWFVNTSGGMAGVVAGDVGLGAYAGQVLARDDASEPGWRLLHATYEFHGSARTFIADVQIRENMTLAFPTATIDGIVTSGWMKGASVTGEFTQYATCPVATPGNVRGALCFQGSATVRGGEAEADATFTKWLVSGSGAMSGVVGGRVGNGIYAGQVLDEPPAPAGFWFGHARYEFHGAKHTFIADLHVVENDTLTPARATITGTVTSGWLTGARVTGRYTVMESCPMATPGNVLGSVCFRGQLHLEFEGIDD